MESFSISTVPLLEVWLINTYLTIIIIAIVAYSQRYEGKLWL